LLGTCLTLRAQYMRYQYALTNPVSAQSSAYPGVSCRHPRHTYTCAHPPAHFFTPAFAGFVPQAGNFVAVLGTTAQGTLTVLQMITTLTPSFKGKSYAAEVWPAAMSPPIISLNSHHLISYPGIQNQYQPRMHAHIYTESICRGGNCLPTWPADPDLVTKQIIN